MPEASPPKRPQLAVSAVIFRDGKVANEPRLNHEHDDFKWVEPGRFGDLKLTGGLPEVVEAARRLI
jgi:hypothetical protein